MSKTILVSNDGWLAQGIDDSFMSSKDRAYNRILSSILNGTYAAGASILVRDICRDLNISRTPVQIALERLAELGLVEINPQRGVTVHRLDPREIGDHYEFRKVAEQWAADRAIEYDATGVGEQLNTVVLEQGAFLTDAIDVQGFMRSDAHFHRLLVNASRNSEVAQAMRLQYIKLQLVVRTIFSAEPAALRKSQVEHRDIANAISRGDVEAARQAIAIHLDNGRRFLLLGGKYGERDS